MWWLERAWGRCGPSWRKQRSRPPSPFSFAWVPLPCVFRAHDAPPLLFIIGRCPLLVVGVGGGAPCWLWRQERPMERVAAALWVPFGSGASLLHVGLYPQSALASRVRVPVFRQTVVYRVRHWSAARSPVCLSLCACAHEEMDTPKMRSTINRKDNEIRMLHRLNVPS